MGSDMNGTRGLEDTVRVLELFAGPKHDEPEEVTQLRFMFILEQIIALTRQVEVQQLTSPDEQELIGDVRTRAMYAAEIGRKDLSPAQRQCFVEQCQEAIDWTGHLLGLVDPRLGTLFYRTIEWTL